MALYQSWEELAAPAIERFIQQGGSWDSIEKLAPPHRGIMALEALEEDMYNGGFLQYFANWGHGNYLRALEVLVNIGATAAVEIISACYDIIRRLEDEDMPGLWAIEGMLTPGEREELRRLDQAYWEDEDKVSERALAFFLPLLEKQAER